MPYGNSGYWSDDEWFHVVVLTAELTDFATYLRFRYPDGDVEIVDLPTVHGERGNR